MAPLLECERVYRSAGSLFLGVGLALRGFGWCVRRRKCESKRRELDVKGGRGSGSSEVVVVDG